MSPVIDSTTLSLCQPDPFRSCFACCPPIRPAGYEHIQYQKSMERILRENTVRFDPGSTKIIPITGFSCWALGYLDKAYRLIGCMLHPAQNKGRDMRFRVDYGEKCKRETCPEAAAFALLTPDTQDFLLDLTEGLNSFEYSSRRRNPLFSLLGWAPLILETAGKFRRNKISSLQELTKRFPILSTPLNPKACSYIVLVIMNRWGQEVIRNPALLRLVEAVNQRLKEEVSSFPPSKDSVHTHTLDLDQHFKDLLRLGLGLKKMNIETALELKEKVEVVVEETWGSMA